MSSPMSEGRKLLEETLHCPEFSSRVELNKFLQKYVDSADHGGQELEDRTSDVWSFLEDMRSASSVDHHSTSHHDTDWKLKDDTRDYRVLYRKGPAGTPLHAICLEGVIEGPAVTALCVAWEAPYFQEWWPQSTIPPFRILESRYVRRIKTGVDLAYIRFKIPWPFASRDMCILSFELEHSAQGAIIALMKSVPESESDVRGTEEYDRSEVPTSEKDVVRMGVTGGYLFQQVSETKCFFRAISNIDLKLDLVPAWLINFVSRQLAGSGFKMFQEAIVEAIENKRGHGAVFQEEIRKGDLYMRVRKALETHLRKGIMNGATEQEEVLDLSSSFDEEANIGDLSARDPEIFKAMKTLERAIKFFKASEIR